jgi:hypothetical protein
MCQLFKVENLILFLSLENNLNCKIEETEIYWWNDNKLLLTLWSEMTAIVFAQYDGQKTEG